jgi:hypothetical protein
MSTDSQFSRAGQYPGNLDRCRRCGYPRKLHGADQRCGVSVSGTAGFISTLTVASGVLAAATWALLKNPAITAGSLAAFAFFVTLIVLMTGVSLAALRTQRHHTRR